MLKFVLLGGCNYYGKIVYLNMYCEYVLSDEEKMILLVIKVRRGENGWVKF